MGPREILGSLFRRKITAEPRRFHAYCIGGPKSGTHSVASVFRSHYRAAHEPQILKFIPFFLEKAKGNIPESESQDYLRMRDAALSLELESNHLLVLFIEDLVSLFPDARFILTMRDCYSFADSMINHMLIARLLRGRKKNKIWSVVHEVLFGTQGREYEEGEELLAHRHLYPLRGYLAAWAKHHGKMLAAVPSDRLLIVRMREIRSSLPKIAEFVGADPMLLNPNKSHTFRGLWKFHVLKQLDPSFVERCVDRHCRGLMDRFFPGLTLQDALAPKKSG
jgi:hypothetical protein